MALFAQLQNLPEELLKQVKSVYSEDFPWEVRLVLADWIESQPWNTIDCNNPDHEEYAASLVSTFIQKVSLSAHTIENNSLKYRLGQSILHFQNHFARDPISLVRIVNHCLDNDARVLQSSHHFLSNMDTKPIITNMRNSNDEICQEISIIRVEVVELESVLRKLNQDEESLVLSFQEHSKLQSMLQTNSADRSKLLKNIEQFETNLQVSAETCRKRCLTLIDKYRDIMNKLNIVQSKVIDYEMERWRRGQQLAGNGVAYEGYTLDVIQIWSESLAELNLQTRIQLKRLQAIGNGIELPPYNLEQIFSLIELNSHMLRALVKSTFVIEKQPPQVMKTNTRFTATVRLLVGGKLNLHMNPPSVSVFIISEHQASIMASESINPIMSQNESAAGEILNNTGIMEYHSTGSQLSVNFRNMQLKKIKRTEKKGTESVMDEKFALMFYSRFNVYGTDFADIHTFSLPVVVIVHGNQEPHAHATITWDNAFAEPTRPFFVVPDKVPFLRVGEVLSQKFIANVGRGLTEDNLRFLAAKALRISNVPDLNVLISWSQFSKEPLPDRNFTFWEWFYAILKVTKEHLRNLWNDETIIGFIWRSQAEEMLSTCQQGTFLLRFSDSELGGLTVAWKGKSTDGTTDVCYMLQPFTSKDFAIRGLADRVNDMKHLTYLFPNIPKDTAFSKYYTPIADNLKTRAGYVKPVLVTCVPGLPGPIYDSYPNTPQSTLQPHSPSDSNSMQYESTNAQLDSNCTSVNFTESYHHY